MANPTLITSYVMTAVASLTTLQSPTFTPAAGEIIIVTLFTADVGEIPGSVSNTGTTPQTWSTNRAGVAATNCGGRQPHHPGACRKGEVA